MTEYYLCRLPLLIDRPNYLKAKAAKTQKQRRRRSIKTQAETAECRPLQLKKPTKATYPRDPRTHKHSLQPQDTVFNHSWEFLCGDGYWCLNTIHTTDAEEEVDSIGGTEEAANVRHMRNSSRGSLLCPRPRFPFLQGP